MNAARSDVEDRPDTEADGTTDGVGRGDRGEARRATRPRNPGCCRFLASSRERSAGVSIGEARPAPTLRPVPRHRRRSGRVPREAGHSLSLFFVRGAMLTHACSLPLCRCRCRCCFFKKPKTVKRVDLEPDVSSACTGSLSCGPIRTTRRRTSDPSGRSHLLVARTPRES